MLRDLRGVIFLWYRFMYNYIQNKKFRGRKFEKIFRVDRVANNRCTFIWPKKRGISLRGIEIFLSGSGMQTRMRSYSSRKMISFIIITFDSSGPNSRDEYVTR